MTELRGAFDGLEPRSAMRALPLLLLAAACSDYEYTELTVTDRFGSELEQTPADLLLVGSPEGVAEIRRPT